MAKTKQDYYETLGISQDADEKAIKDAFRKLTLKYHPDRNKSPEAESRYKKIAEAYTVLADAEKRRQYDQQGFADLSGFSQQDLYSGIDFEDLFSDLGSSFGKNSIFDNFFSRGKKTRQTKGQDLDIRAYVTLDRIASGGDEVIRLNRKVPCSSCKGSGAAAGSEAIKCNACAGSGQQVTKSEKRAGTLFQQITSCPICHGKGTVIEKPCHQCMGLGIIDKEESLTVKIPKGAEEGLMLKIPGHGLAALDPVLPAGDLYIRINTYSDPRFQRKGAELWHARMIELTDAVLGTQLKVPTLKGYAMVEVPAGTQMNDILKLKDKGLPVQGTDQYGDLNIRIDVHIPRHISEREKSLYQELRALRGCSESN
jgi:molecular chaperone DnaJ